MQLPELFVLCDILFETDSRIQRDKGLRSNPANSTQRCTSGPLKSSHHEKTSVGRDLPASLVPIPDSQITKIRALKLTFIGLRIVADANLTAWGCGVKLGLV